MWTRRLADADATCGGKAHGLARLIGAGLRVPEGFVVEDRAFRGALDELAIDSRDAIGHGLAEAAQRIESCELPDDLVREVESAARVLGGKLAVRSSASIEDGEVGAAAGVFSSRTAVSFDDLWPAIRAVWASALTPLAASYARRRDATITIAVIVQRFVEGDPVIVYSRPPGDPAADTIWVQHAGRAEQQARTSQLGALAARVESAIESPRGADIELVVPIAHEPATGHLAVVIGLDYDAASIVQARPIVHPVFKQRLPPPPTVLAALDDGRIWKLDVTHNPDPLSPAQVGLVELVEREGAAPWSSRVCAGYLYTTSREVPVAPTYSSARELMHAASAIEQKLLDTLDGREGTPPLSVASTTEPEPTLAEIAATGGDCELEFPPTWSATPTTQPIPLALDEALRRYVAFVRIWAYKLGPLIAAHRGVNPPLAGDRASAVEHRLAQAVRHGLHDFFVDSFVQVLSPAWDVAVPTFAERPGLLRDAIARAQIALPRPLDEAATPRSDRDDHDLLVAFAADLAEVDDHWFARAQWMVRRAIQERAHVLGISMEDAFWLPLDELVAGVDAVDASRRASGARAAAARASSWNMPIVVGAPTTESGVALRGFGFGPKVTGRVRRFDSLASAIVVGRGEIVVTRAVTPALAVIVVGCAAIVSETGGPLDHGAAMARELGIPCVVGCRDAWARLADGMIVTVEDGVVVPTASDSNVTR